MKPKLKLVLAGLIAMVLCLLLLPPLARRIDSTVQPGLERSAAYEAQYREMTNAYQTAGELLPDHPTRKLWEERRAALMQAGYIETREFQLKSLAAKGATKAFFTAFYARFPGVEFTLRGAKSDTPVLVVTARKSDLSLFGNIQVFANQYDAGK